jgi:drug/metabolite transporter (DMT)-like permease
VAVILGLAAAATYGAADFFGGLMTRRTGVFGVVLVSQVIGSAVFFLALPFLLQEEPTARALLWGALAGMAGGAGVTLFYRALALGRMSIIAPVTGVEAAILPVMWGLASGERPSGPALGGVVLAVTAVALISSGERADPSTRSRGLPPGLLHAFGAGAGFGVFFILLAEAGDDGGLWSLVSVRLASIALVGSVAIIGRRSIRPAPGTTRGIAAAGLFDMSANLLYLLASREGLLSIVAVLTSMYPATTVLLARFALGERMSRVQVLGLVAAGAGITLIGIG